MPSQPQVNFNYTYGNDEKPITAKGQYAIPVMSDEIDGLPIHDRDIDPKHLHFIDDLSEKQQAHSEHGLMEKVYTGFHDLINK
jgi:hypothetical protein